MKNRPNQKLKQKNRFKKYIDNIEQRSEQKLLSVQRGRAKINGLLSRLRHKGVAAI